MVDKNAHYLMCKGGVFYFTRHVPNDLKRHYETPRIVICLKTRSKNATTLRIFHVLYLSYLTPNNGSSDG